MSNKTDDWVSEMCRMHRADATVPKPVPAGAAGPGTYVLSVTDTNHCVVMVSDADGCTYWIGGSASLATPLRREWAGVRAYRICDAHRVTPDAKLAASARLSMSVSATRAAEASSAWVASVFARLGETPPAPANLGSATCGVHLIDRPGFRGLVLVIQSPIGSIKEDTMQRAEGESLCRNVNDQQALSPKDKTWFVSDRVSLTHHPGGVDIVEQVLGYRRTYKNFHLRRKLLSTPRFAALQVETPTHEPDRAATIADFGVACDVEGELYGRNTAGMVVRLRDGTVADLDLPLWVLSKPKIIWPEIGPLIDAAAVLVARDGYRGGEADLGNGAFLRRDVHGAAVGILVLPEGHPWWGKTHHEGASGGSRLHWPSTITNVSQSSTAWFMVLLHSNQEILPARAKAQRRYVPAAEMRVRLKTLVAQAQGAGTARPMTRPEEIAKNYVLALRRRSSSSEIPSEADVLAWLDLRYVNPKASRWLPDYSIYSNMRASTIAAAVWSWGGLDGTITFNSATELRNVRCAVLDMATRLLDDGAPQRRVLWTGLHGAIDDNDEIGVIRACPPSSASSPMATAMWSEHGYDPDRPAHLVGTAFFVPRGEGSAHADARSWVRYPAIDYVVGRVYSPDDRVLWRAEVRRHLRAAGRGPVKIPAAMPVVANLQHLVSEAETVVEAKIRAEIQTGAHVRVVRVNPQARTGWVSRMDHTVGMTGIVDEVIAIGVRVRFDDGDDWLYDEEDLEIVSAAAAAAATVAETTTAFEVGSRVRIVKRMSGPNLLWPDEMDDTIGQVGKVIRVVPVGNVFHYEVRTKSSAWYYLRESIESEG